MSQINATYRHHTVIAGWNAERKTFFLEVFHGPYNRLFSSLDTVGPNITLDEIGYALSQYGLPFPKLFRDMIVHHKVEKRGDDFVEQIDLTKPEKETT